MGVRLADTGCRSAQARHLILDEVHPPRRLFRTARSCCASAAASCLTPTPPRTPFKPPPVLWHGRETMSPRPTEKVSTNPLAAKLRRARSYGGGEAGAFLAGTSPKREQGRRA